MDKVDISFRHHKDSSWEWFAVTEVTKLTQLIKAKNTFNFASGKKNSDLEICWLDKLIVIEMVNIC